ncbi:aminotransferase class I/II-fold pyridoxal phosphate-dependent enzyme [Puniceicoccales bacterium CK1056]|uniref:Aminotransferase n=1 Tax=Oceanipulchritudo coccoides TaxID=2706888 RepID=A0A6B2M2U5_9BACT|nr:aminotransferase class I/II-fold pyridoxal phosphate-dependent enzyme [Oceanipulchritudo coccoides]NDV62519.1 aminotransferase class I/II-fold pyridoxal phosphate-dependent enzyme [Oceanipulchritudo coccoides]
MNYETVIAHHVQGLNRSGIRDFFALVQQMPNAISLGIGEPDFVTPWNIREAAIYSLEKGKTSYTDNLGLYAFRREVARYVERKFGLSYDGQTECLIGIGVSETMDTAIRALVNPGDKVLYHEPCYVSYSPSVQLAGGIPIAIPTHAKDNFALRRADLDAKWEPGCKLLILNFPTNPTGGVVEREQLEEIAAFAIEKDLIVLSDEIYAELTYDGEHVSIASFPGMRERTVFLHGVSKAFAMTGFRIGYACAPHPIIEAMMKVHQYAIMSVPIFIQEAGIEALRNSDDAVASMRESYQRRRDLLVRRFREMGLKCHLPQATFYTFPDVTPTGLDGKTFATRLLQQGEVAVVPGTAFGTDGHDFVRASFSTQYAKIEKACDRMQRFVESL